MNDAFVVHAFGLLFIGKCYLKRAEIYVAEICIINALGCMMVLVPHAYVVTRLNYTNCC